MPAVSVVVPVYNTEKYILKCLKSILNQSLKDLEIICVNDCSTDNSKIFIENLAKSDNRLKIVNLPENRGISNARNTGIEHAKGDYIYFIDSDDWLDEFHIEEMLTNIKNQDANIVINANFVNEYENQDKQEYSSFEFFDGDKNYSSKILQRLFPPVVWARLYNASYIKDNNFIFPKIAGGAEDIYYTAAAELPLDNIYVYKGVPYHYLQRPTSIMKQSARGFHYIEAFKFLYDYLCKYGISLDGVKLYCGESLILDTEDKYNFTKNYLLEIEDIINRNNEIYNDYENFVCDCIKNTKNYADFTYKYNKNLSISYVRNKIRKDTCKI